MFIPGPACFTKWGDWTSISSRTRRRSTCAGGFSWRVIRSLFLPQIELVCHSLAGEHYPRGMNESYFLNFRNNLIMMAKNLPATQCLGSYHSGPAGAGSRHGNRCLRARGLFHGHPGGASGFLKWVAMKQNETFSLKKGGVSWKAGIPEVLCGNTLLWGRKLLMK